MKKNLIAILFIIFSLISCREKQVFLKKPFYDPHKQYVGDSIFLDKKIKKILFVDTTYGIDSIVFSRYTQTDNIESIHTFKSGKNIFENKDYYENGRLKKYLFIDQDSSNYYYERMYSDNGVLEKVTGYLFFQGIIVDTTSRTMNMKKGSTVEYLIYYPNPPDCESRIFIKNDDGTVYDVFSKSNFLNFLQTVYQDNPHEGAYKVNVVLEQKDKSRDTTFNYSKAVIFKVVP